MVRRRLCFAAAAAIVPARPLTPRAVPLAPRALCLQAWLHTGQLCGRGQARQGCAACPNWPVMPMSRRWQRRQEHVPAALPNTW